jgi:hypothetical protein
MVPPPLVRCFKPPIAKSCWLQRPIHLQAYPSRTQQRPPSPKVVQDTPTNNCDWLKFNSAKLQDDRNLHFLLYPPIPNRRAYKRCRPSKLSPQIRDTGHPHFDNASTLSKGEAGCLRTLLRHSGYTPNRHIPRCGTSNKVEASASHLMSPRCALYETKSSCDDQPSRPKGQGAPS